jgi:polyphosphate kinase
MARAKKPESGKGIMDATVTASVETSQGRYFNREMSWLQFNWRVLNEVRNDRYPLLERLRFLSISGSNLDEFFMVRVAGLRGQEILKLDERSIDGLSATQQLALIERDTDALMSSQQAAWGDIQALLVKAGISVLSEHEITKADSAALAAHFRAEIFPILTPQALDPAHPFPFIPNLGLNMIFDLKRIADGEAVRELIMVPPGTARFTKVPGSEGRFVSMEVMLRCFAAILFPGYHISASTAFRVIRDSDIALAEEAEDLVLSFRNALKRRRRGRVIRLEVESQMSNEIEQLILRRLGGGRTIIAETEGLLGIADLSDLVEEDRPDLKFMPFSPRFPERIREHDGDCFAAIRQKDFIVHHPYESFDVVVAFLNQAAADADVIAIKQMLYRAGKQSAVIRALCDAAEAGKSVTAVVELRARFDEEQNLEWAAQLERSGVQVVYGFAEWKTHAKISMVVRKEGKKVRTYCHFGTGNYHPQTARTYTDLSFFTADPRAGRDAAKAFNYITGYVEPGELELLTISPRDLRNQLIALIDREVARADQGKPGAIWAKLNALADQTIIEKLYEASAAGVSVDLVIRGVCCLRPGVPGLSENIRVKSIIGRFLEHSRVWAFGNGRELPNAKADVFISSADWMSRNFDRRIEYAIPIKNETVRAQILEQVMLANFLDDEQSWLLLPDGRYQFVEPGDQSFNLHRYFITNPSLSGRGAALSATGAVPKLKLKRKK